MIKLNKYRSTTVTYTLGSTTEVIDAGTIETWLQITDDSLNIDQEAVKSYVQNLCSEV